MRRTKPAPTPMKPWQLMILRKLLVGERPIISMERYVEILKLTGLRCIVHRQRLGERPRCELFALHGCDPEHELRKWLEAHGHTVRNDAAPTA